MEVDWVDNATHLTWLSMWKTFYIPPLFPDSDLGIIQKILTFADFPVAASEEPEDLLAEAFTFLFLPF